MSELPKDFLEEESDTTRRDWVVNFVKRTQEEIRACYAKKLEGKAEEIEELRAELKKVGGELTMKHPDLTLKEGIIEGLEEQNAHLRLDKRNLNENLERESKTVSRLTKEILTMSEFQKDAGKAEEKKREVGFEDGFKKHVIKLTKRTPEEREVYHAEKTAGYLARIKELEEVNKELRTEISRLQQKVFGVQRDGISGTVSPTTAEIAANAPVIVHKWESGERPIALKLTKTTKGYTWEISMKGTDAEKIFEEVEIFEAEVRLKYGEDRWETVATSGETSPPKS